jgi:hypothetical protein
MKKNIIEKRNLIIMICLMAFCVISVFIGSLRAARHYEMLDCYNELSSKGLEVSIDTDKYLVKGINNDFTHAEYYDCTNPILLDYTEINSVD